MPRLTAAECRPFFDAVTAKAVEIGAPVSMAVVGPEGHLIALERMDEAGFITPETAHAKAYTAVAFRTMSPRFPDGLVIQKWFMERNPQMMVATSIMKGGLVVASGGCAPVFKGDTLVGAYGISGGTSDQDEVMARHACTVCSWSIRAANDTTSEGVKVHIAELYSKAGIKDRTI